MTKKIAILFILLSFFSCRPSVKASDAEVKSFFKQLQLKTYNPKAKVLIIDSMITYQYNTIIRMATKDGICTDDELMELSTAMNSGKPGVWKKEFFPRGQIVSRKWIDSASKADPLRYTPEHYGFSLPCFTSNKKFCLVSYYHYCGNLCMERSLRLYRNVNGHWEFVKDYGRLVS